MPTPLTPGTLVDGRYTIRAVLGSGGMGEVYEAEDLALPRLVALKTLRGAAHRQGDAERLFREAQAAARAQHPAVVTPFAHGSDPDTGLDYLVMERLVGETLAARLAREGALPVPLAVGIAIDLADALHALHTVAVVHRDLKPDNVFLVRRARGVPDVKLLDLGVARLGGMPTLTSTGEVYGTLAYMAPEQLRDAHHVDGRADQYALGAVLYECITGKPLRTARSQAQLALDIVLGGAPSLQHMRALAPAWLVDVTARCLQPSRDRRFHDTLGVATALARGGD